MTPTRRTSRAALVLSAAAVLLLSGVGASSASAAKPGWEIVSTSNTAVAPGAQLTYVVDVVNRTDAPSDGSPVRVTATLPAGVTGASFTGGSFGFECGAVAGLTTIECQAGGSIIADEPQELRLTVAVDPDAGGLRTAHFAVSGGGLAPDATVDPVAISSAASRFGIDAFDARLTDAAGASLTRAAAHPADFATLLDFNTHTDLSPTPSPLEPNPIIGPTQPVEPVKDIAVDLPPGLIGNPAGLPQCTAGQLANTASVEPIPLCPSESQIGTALILLNSPLAHVGGPYPVFNMVPPPGAPARFGINVSGTVVAIDATLRSDSDYGLTAISRNTSAGVPVIGAHLDFWGVPSDPSHDSERSCPGEKAPGRGGLPCLSDAEPRAFFRNPTACTALGEGLPFTVRADSWFHPGVFDSRTAHAHAGPGYPFGPEDWGPELRVEACDAVSFEPTLTVTPTTNRADSPTGLSVDLRVPQGCWDATATAAEAEEAVCQSDLRDAAVTLPAGMSVNPSAAAGLAACTPAQVGLTTPVGRPGAPIHFDEAPAACPDAAKIGTVEIETPLLGRHDPDGKPITDEAGNPVLEPLTGSVYVAQQSQNPFGSLLAIYLVAEGSGIIVKQAGEIEAAPDGRLTTRFTDTPQTPFSRLHLELFGGERAALRTPSACGSYTTTGELTPWSGNPAVPVSSSFQISQGCGGGFDPKLDAGTQNPLAGSYSPFSLRLTRTDQDSPFNALTQLNLPPGLLADAASVPVRCTDAQAAAAACPQASHIGTVTVGAGAGPNPFYQSGDVYLMGQQTTGPFTGDPFGLAVVVHALAGPFDLGYVVVRAGIQIHSDGSVTTRSEPFPSILQGIPLQLRDIRVNLDRSGFMLNPTSCAPQVISGMVSSLQGQTAGVGSRFQAGDCASLAFKPSFTVSTAGKTSKANGASLHVHLATHEGPGSTGGARESNIAKVDVQLPVVLPARLPTLQKACTAAQFAANPAGCPEGSFVGTAVAHTPILTSPLSGPAILVSHGGEAFPDLVLVLQGEGVRINLTGHTQIKKGITFSHFETVPDAPVSSFDLTLPQGPHGVLTTDVPGRNLCASTKTVTTTKRVTRRVNGHTKKVTVKVKKAVAAPLLMPTTITAQNGAIINQTTKIAVTGCAKTKVAKHTVKGRK